MAIPINKNSNPLDRDSRKFIGIKIPFEKSNDVGSNCSACSGTVSAISKSKQIYGRRENSILRVFKKY